MNSYKIEYFEEYIDAAADRLEVLENGKSDGKKKAKASNDYKLVDEHRGEIGTYFTDTLYQAWVNRNPDFKALVKAADLSYLNANGEKKVKEAKKVLNLIWDYMIEYYTNQTLTKEELTPNANLVKQYVNSFCLKDEPFYNDIHYTYDMENAHYQKQFKAIDLMMEKLRYDNSESAVILKVSVLNALYSTNIRNIYPVVEQICKIDDFNKKVMKNDDSSELVELITNAEGADANYSFATKYCHIHNPEKYPIYDSFAAGMLIFFHFKYRKDLVEKNGKINLDDLEIIPTGHPNKKCSCTKLSNILKDYGNYKTAINNFMKAYDLKPNADGAYFSYQDIDKYLWGFGRKHNISVNTVAKKLKSNGIDKK